jgi:acyl-CoA thioesterase FadM
MYPVLRFAWQFYRHRNDPPLSLADTHVSQHLCLPWDLDLWWELNNGRTLTLYDLGRLPFARRSGLLRVVRQKGWFLTVAGASIRYRRRVQMFDRLTMRSRAAGWDERFFYVEQSMWKSNGDCASHVLLRMAVADKAGLVPAPDLAAAMGFAGPPPALPDWVAAWAAAEALRPWPPMQDAAA